MCRGGFQEELRRSGPAVGREVSEARQRSEVYRLELQERDEKIKELSLKVQLQAAGRLLGTGGKITSAGECQGRGLDCLACGFIAINYCSGFNGSCSSVVAFGISRIARCRRTSVKCIAGVRGDSLYRAQ